MGEKGESCKGCDIAGIVGGLDRNEKSFGGGVREMEITKASSS